MNSLVSMSSSPRSDTAFNDAADWKICPSREARGSFTSEHHDGGDIRIIEYRWDLCTGARKPVEGRLRNELGLAFVVSGKERCWVDGREILVGPGDAMTWHENAEQSFEVIEPIHKVTFVMPEHRLKGLYLATDHTADIHIASASEMGRLLSGYLTAFTAGLSQPRTAASLDMTLEVLARCIAASRPAATTPRANPLLQQIFKFIESELPNPDLSPTTVADAHRVSVRYLHQLFADHSLTVAAFIRSRRLERCRTTLAANGTFHKISDVATSWGFKDVAHFCRLFKSSYHMTPDDFRRLSRLDECRKAAA
jgi:AraC-like DNA-binding protein